jgi:predicted DNA-binding transcriptional regulator YafY
MYTTLPKEDRKLVAEVKAERKRLRRELANISDAKLAEKFEVSLRTIQRIPEAWIL